MCLPALLKATLGISGDGKQRTLPQATPRCAHFSLQQDNRTRQLSGSAPIRLAIARRKGHHRSNLMQKLEPHSIAYHVPLFDLLHESSFCSPRLPFDLRHTALFFLSIQDGRVSRGCGYCGQSAHYNTGLKREALLSVEQVRVAARAAKDRGAQRFCIGAAWRQAPEGERSSACSIWFAK